CAASAASRTAPASSSFWSPTCRSTSPGRSSRCAAAASSLPTEPTTMRAAVLESRGRDGLKLRDFPKPVPKPGEALLRVHAVGLNRCDLYMREHGAGIAHELPLVQGVKAAGVVAEAPAGSGLTVGQKAVLYSNAFCGHCRHCRAGDQPLCLHADIMGEHRH